MARPFSASTPALASATFHRSPQCDVLTRNSVESTPNRAAAPGVQERNPRINRHGAVYYSHVDAESDAALSRRARAGDS